MCVAISGVAGFIGSHIAEALLSDGHEALGFDNFSGGDAGNVPQGAKCVVADMRNAAQMETIFKKFQPEVVIHAAAYAAEGYSHWCRSFLYENNVVGTANVLNAAVNHGVKHFIFLSSIAVYGKTKESGAIESDLCAFEDPYGAAKALSERDIEIAGKMFGINWTIFRPHNVCGENQNAADRTRNFVSIAIRHALEGKPIPIYGDGSQTRQFTPVSYVADCIAACVNKPECHGQVYNVGIDEPMSIYTMAQHVMAAISQCPGCDFLPQRHEVVHAACDHSKLRAAFPDIKPQSIFNCLSEMVAEARSKPFAPYQEPPTPEINLKLPEWAKAK